MVAGHILESTKGIKNKLGHTYMLMRGSTDDKNHNPILHFTLIISPYFFHKRLFSLSCLGVQVVFGLQDLSFIDNSHLWSILCFQRFSCYNQSLLSIEIKFLTLGIYISAQKNLLKQEIFFSFFFNHLFFFI